jgi:hypothetical protein
VPILSRLRGMLKKHSALLIKPFGIHLLSKQESESYLTSFEKAHLAGRTITLKSVPDLLLNRTLFVEGAVTTSSVRVWRYENTSGKARQLPNGSLMVERQVLDTDFGNSIVVKDWLVPQRRSTRAVKMLIAPWSHYWTGYYDFLFFVALKLCRIKNTLSAAEFQEAVVCYPLFYTNYEQDILALFGFGPERLFDSRLIDVRFETCLLGSNDSWFYVNEQDIYAFKQLIETYLAKHLTFEKRQGNRIYVRRAGRRKVLNEESLLKVLQQYNFQIIEDVPRTLLEQVQIYYHAAFVIGPHGAAFANILWCQPGTHLFELFPNTYTPDYFRYLAQTLGLTYSAYCYGEPLGSDHQHVQDNVYVDIEELERCLLVAFGTNAI